MRFDMRLACACEDTAPLPGVRLPGVQRPGGGKSRPSFDRTRAMSLCASGLHNRVISLSSKSLSVSV